MADCKACGRWFASTDPNEEICYVCRHALERLNGYAVPVKWIPVSEFPMNVNGHYLTCDNKGNMHVMYHYKGYDVPFGVDENHAQYFPVRYFMPLPQPPKGE